MLIDFREDADIIEALRQRGINVEVKTLEVGDYLFADVAVERKSIGDLYNSIKKDRLWNELINIKNNFSRPVWIVEGIISEPFTRQDILRNQTLYYAFIANAMGELKVPIIPTISRKETARVLHLMYARSSRDKKEYLRPVKKKSLTPREIKSDFICTLPFISRKKAKKLLEKFKTLKALVEASPEEIAEIKGISKNMAEQYVKLFRE